MFFRSYSVITQARANSTGPGSPGPVSAPVPRQADECSNFAAAIGSSDLGRPKIRVLDLAAQAEALDQRAVPRDVGAPQVAEQAAAAADEQQQAAAAVVVVLVHLQVLVQVVDPAGHERDLDLRRTGVTLIDRVLRKDLLLNFSVERHVAP